MPTKRKALSQAAGNTRTTKAPKKSAKDSAAESSSKKPAKEPAKAPTRSSARTSAKPSVKESSSKTPVTNPPAEVKASSSKYCNANTLSQEIGYQNLQWPNIADFINDKNQDMPAEGQLLTEFCYRVSDLGIPISTDGAEMGQKLSKECQKRDQDMKDVFIYNDWNGWGVSEVMRNLLKEFNGVVYKKTVSPYKKWAFVEGFACWVKMEDGYVGDWMGNEDGEGVTEIANMIGTMVLTVLDMLSEHDLLKPDSKIVNIPIICLLLIEFLNGDAQDLECEWGQQILRLCDENGIELEKNVRKQVSVKKGTLKSMRDSYKKTKEGSDWDWTREYNEFKRNHPGGKHYDLSGKTKAQMKKMTAF